MNNKNSESNRSIYIMLSHTGTIFTRMISQYTKAAYNHVTLCMNKELQENYSFGRKIPWIAISGGFVKEIVDEGGVYDYFPKTQSQVYELTVSEKQYNNLQKELEAFQRNGRWYWFNVFGFIGVVLGRPMHLPGGYFCSEFVAEILKRSGINLFNKPSSLVTPVDFYYCDDLKLIFSGRLRNHPDIKNRRKQKREQRENTKLK